MTEKKCTWDSFKAEGATVVDKIKTMVHEGNVRRVVVEHDGRTVAEFPLAMGVVGAVLAPAVAAIAAVVALYKDCTIHVERTDPPEAAGPAQSSAPAEKASA
jgi:hypothetical protein